MEAGTTAGRTTVGVNTTFEGSLPGRAGRMRGNGVKGAILQGDFSSFKCSILSLLIRPRFFAAGCDSALAFRSLPHGEFDRGTIREGKGKGRKGSKYISEGRPMAYSL